jgi:DNA-binding transcriptional LysR family regulator
VDLSLKVASNPDLVKGVLDHELDGAFVCGPVQHSELTSHVVFEEELVIAAAASSDPAGVIAPGCKILVKGAGCAYRERLDALLSLKGVSQVSRMEFGTLDALIGCLEAGLGATLLPRSLLESAADAGRLRLTRVRSEIGRVETQFIRRRDAGDFSAIRALLQELGAVVTPSIEGDHTAA